MATKVDVVTDPTGVPNYTEIKLGASFANFTREYVKRRNEIKELEAKQKKLSTKLLVLLGATGLTKTIVENWMVNIIDPERSKLSMDQLYTFMNVHFGITADQMEQAITECSAKKKGKAYVTVNDLKKKGKKEKVQ